MANRVEEFEDLEAWQIAIDVAVMVYEVTSKYPKSELYSLTNQMRRASSSISANIAEGFGRYNTKEKAQFYKIANGSLLELKSFCYLSKRLSYIDDDQLEALLSAITSSQKLTNALIRSQKERL